MSTKINVRSPFYLSYSEPTEPSVELTCSLINLNNLSIDQFGSVTLPNTTYGNILSYTSSDSDFTDGRFATVSTATPRTITFTISIPPNFSNASDDTIDCTASATQPVFTCTGGVTTNGSIPNQSIDTQGDTVTIDLSSYFTQGVDPIQTFDVLNNYPDYFTTILTGNDLEIIGGYRAGVKNLYITASDGDDLTCDATQSIQVTTTAQETYDCDDAYLSGGTIAQDGTITDPDVNGTIASKSLTSGGAHITSYSANNTGSARDVTLFFDITVPTGYSNAGAEFICPKTFIQPSSALPTFDCEVAGLSGQAITSTGIISVGSSRNGSISGFSPIKFDSVTTATERVVDFKITIPASGYNNSGDDPYTCSVTMEQPPSQAALSCGDADWWMDTGVPFMTVAQVEAAFPLGYPAYWNNVSLSIEAKYNSYGAYNTASLGSAATQAVSLHSDNPNLNINKAVCVGHQDSTTQIDSTRSNSSNPSGGQYHRITKTRELYGSPLPSQMGDSYYIKKETNGVISELWLVDWLTGRFRRIDNI